MPRFFICTCKFFLDEHNYSYSFRSVTRYSGSCCHRIHCTHLFNNTFIYYYYFLLRMKQYSVKYVSAYFKRIKSISFAIGMDVILYLCHGINLPSALSSLRHFVTTSGRHRIFFFFFLFFLIFFFG